MDGCQIDRFSHISDDKVYGLNFTDETICEKVGHQLLR